MADAMCGPSNPLQQFKQQTQFDPTLQQDRLASKQTPAQGFRSANPNEGLLDPEFEAFQAGVPPSELPNFHPFQQRPPDFAGPSQAPSWASDFQRMQISPSPALQQHVPQAGPAAANWAQGFREHIAQTAPRAQTSAPSPQAFQHMARYGGMNGFQSKFSQPSFAQPMQSKGKEAVMEQFDEAAFERAFDQAREDMMAGTEEMETDQMVYERGASTGNYEVQGRLSQEEAELHHLEHLPRPDVLQRLESDPIAEELLREDDSTVQTEDEQPEQDKQKEDDDALALTAQELLEKVEHNQTDKFRNSQFLSLMRKLRDREVKVEGNDMVETSTTESVVRSALLHTHSKALPSLQLPPTSASPPDSAYVSGTATPELHPSFDYKHLLYRRTPPPEFDSHFEHGWGEEHGFDHWESPYR